METVEELREQFKAEHSQEDLFTVFHVKWLEDRLIKSQQPTIDREKVEEIIDRFISWDENEEAVIHWRKFPELADALCSLPITGIEQSQNKEQPPPYSHGFNKDGRFIGTD